MSVKRICSLLLLVFFLILLSLNFAGGYREVEIPSPIPNLEVKHFIADNTAGSPSGNVGRCQLLSFFTKKDLSFFCIPPSKAFFNLNFNSSSFWKKLFYLLTSAYFSFFLWNDLAYFCYYSFLICLHSSNGRAIPW